MIKRWLQEGNPRQRITELEAQVDRLTKERDAWEFRAHEVEEERNELREQYSTDATAQARRIDACLRERDEAIHQCNALQLQLNEERTLRMEVIEHRNSLQARLNEAIAPKPKRTSRAKPPAQEGKING